mgnify:FL=1|jgi:hypothetical protein|tara:strand:- start:4115 stop:4357 length:243 start_codon:yes stop_codon:yes gene_type:complete
MSSEVKKIIQSLEKGEVEITFKSLKSGRNITEKCTLNENLTPKGFSIKQSIEAESILCYLIEKKRWEDIKKETIVGYKDN